MEAESQFEKVNWRNIPITLTDRGEKSAVLATAFHRSGYIDLKRATCPRRDSMKTLKVSLIASVIGIGAWMLGLMRAIWPAHPQLAAFFLTLGITFVLMYVWPEPEK